jgi:sugar phosphate isomerase/epimerase
VKKPSGRRSFFKKGVLGLAGLGALTAPGRTKGEAAPRRPGPAPASDSGPPFKLGLVTYNLAKDWDIDTLIKNCAGTGFEAVELRTTHKHGVELSLSKTQRAEVRKRFADSPVRLLSLGTTCEYESPDPAVVEKNIEETRRWCELAQDLGCLGVKVRPNGFPKDIPHEKTLEQIGHALSTCGDAARQYDVEIWLEVHGNGTQEPPNIHRILTIANHPAVGACWNSNDTDVMNGSVKRSFELLRPWIRNCHINELWRTLSPWNTAEGLGASIPTPGLPDWQTPYPWHEFFGLLRAAGYDRYALAEIPGSPEPIRLMHYYRALWQYHAA